MIRPKRYLIKLAERELQLGDRTLIMGIINVTPDSFSDGGQTMDPDRACARALELEEAGADIIDIGAESTRPGSERISEAEELRRLIPVLKKLKGKLSVPISVDTTKAAVAQKALENGAEIINDASTLTFDSELAKVVAEANAGLVLNHMRGTPETWSKLGTLAHPMKAVMEDLEAGINRARRAGIDRTRIIVDPGLGFGKRGEQNYELIARLGELTTFDLPVLVGPSRKTFLGQQETIDADRATAAAVTAAVLHGAHIVRVHDVAAIRAVLQTADGIVRSVSDEPVEKPKKAAKLAGPPVLTEGKPLRPELAAKAGGVVKPFEERPARRFDSDERPPRRFDSDERPPRRADSDERPVRKYDRDDRPPRRFDSGDRPPRPYQRDDRPPPRRTDGPDRPPRRFDSSDRPPRPYQRDDRQPSRPAGGDDRPPRRFTKTDDRPPRPYQRDDRPPPRRFEGGDDRPPKRFDAGGDRPPFKKTYGAKNAGDRPPFKRAGEGSSDRPPFKRAGSEGGSDRPPFKKSFGSKPGGFKKDSGGFKPKRSGPVRSPRPRRDD